jgi:hypothetical protein
LPLRRLAVCTYALENLNKAVHEACIEVNIGVMGFECLDKVFNEG